MDYNDRLSFLIAAMSKLLGYKVDMYYELNNTPLYKLAHAGGGPYRRARSWILDKLYLNPKKDLKKTTQELYHQEAEKNFQLMDSRNKKYGESWKVLTIPSIANLIEMKMNRIAHMDIKNLDPKIEDELRDTANYAIFALIKLVSKE